MASNPGGGNNSGGDLLTRLQLDLTPFKRALGNATSSVKKFGQDLRNAIDPRALNNAQNGMNNLNNATRQTNNSVRQLGMSMKDLERIVGGILLAQAFYGAKSAIESAASELVTFINDMEKAQIALEYFLETPQQARAFLADINDFAATTSFNTVQALTLARKLQGAQFNPNEVRPVLEILNDAAAASGGTAEQIDRIVLALTQIKTNGKLAGQELRQLAEAGIPIYQILQEELGLTGPQVTRIADQDVNGDKAVEAILNGLQKRYDGAAERIALTLPGLVETIKDDSKILGQALFQAPYDEFANFIKGFRDTLEEARDALNRGGLGAVLEELVPPELHVSIRAIAGSLASLGNSAKILFRTLQPVVAIMAKGLVTALGVLLPAFAAVIRILVGLTQALFEAVPAIKYVVAALVGLVVAQTVATALLFLWRVMRIGILVSSALTKALVLLRAVVLRHPFLIAIVAVLHFTGVLKQATGYVSALIKRLGDLAGFDLDLQLPNIAPDFAEIDEYTSKWKSNLGGAGEELDEAADKAKKLKNFTASFDELFQVPDDEKDGLADAIPDLGDFDPLDLTDGFPDTIELPEFVFPNIDIPEILPAIRKLTKEKPKPPPPNPPPEPDPRTVPVTSPVTVPLPERNPGYEPNPKPGVNPYPQPVPFPLEPVISPKEEKGFRDKLRERLNDLREQVKDLNLNQPVIGAPQLARAWDYLSDQVATVSKPVITALQGFGVSAKNVLTTGFTAAGNVVGVAWQNVLRGTQTTLGFVSNTISGFASSTFNTLSGWGSSIAGVAGTAWNAISSGAVIGFTTSLNAVQSFATSSLNTIQGWGASIRGFFGSLPGVLGGLFTSLMSTLAGVLRTGLDRLTSFWQNWGFVIKEVLFIAITTLIGVFTAGLGTILINAVRWLPRMIKVFAGLLPGIVGVVRAIPGQVVSIIGSIVGRLPAVVSAIARTFKTLPAQIYEYIKSIPGLLARAVEDVPVVGQLYKGGRAVVGGIGSAVSSIIPGYATGGIIQREHMAMVGEGGRKEAIIPLQNAGAMQPFVDAVVRGLQGSQPAPSNDSDGQQQILYVGNLIADERGLRELERRMKVIRQSEQGRGRS